MGFYIRKSISVGPFRFNLSKSGIGLSAGVKGFRIGTGPRGNYVHMGRGGLYYRATLNQPAGKATGVSPLAPQPLGATQEVLHGIDSAATSSIVDSSSADLVDEMNVKQKKLRMWPVVLATGLILWLVLANNVSVPAWVATTVFYATFPLAAVAWAFDALRKTTVLFFELEPDIERLYQNLHDAFAALSSCAGCWHVAAEGRVTDRKRNAGASSVVRRTGIRIKKGNPPYVKSNVVAPSIPVGKQTLYFFPDKVLVFEPNVVGAVSYKNLMLAASQTRFIEDGSVPKDARVVDKTWKYVNKKGGPDKRFNSNRELPITLYEDIDLRSGSGLNERIQVSRIGIGAKVAEAIRTLAGVSE